jgi:predicted nucleic acid-binding protein
LISALDTNVLVYATDPSAGARQLRALDLLDRAIVSGQSILLLQVLTEFCSVAMRKLRTPVPNIAALVDGWRSVLAVRAPVDEDLAAALDIVTKHRLAFWDAMLWATARRAGVQYLLSEDFQDGRQLAGLQFVNPFNSANDSLIDRILPP